MTRLAPNLRKLTSAQVAAALAWSAALAVHACIVFIVTRGCGYNLGAVAAYAAYFAAHVALPGVVAVAALNRGQVSLMTAVALGIPTGFALEIFTFLGLAAIGAKTWLPAIPIVWLAGGILVWRRHRVAPVAGRLSARHAGPALALSVLFLGTVITVASQMFVESPLVDGLPQRPIFHDWVYLVSRAAAIKGHWPLEDPSLAGTPLRYHYFMLVHAAAASSITGLELSLVCLRLMIVPLGAVVIVQVYALGRRLSASAWGGGLAAVLTVASGELGFTNHPNHSVFVGRFVRWLHVSPTLYFGVVFLGALILAVDRWQRLPRVRAIDAAWLCLLAAAATGAKGTVLPVLIPAMGLFAAWSWWRRRAFPTRLVLGGVCLGASFAVVYFATMAGLRSGVALAPFDVFQVGDFWQARFPAWTAALERWLPARGAVLLATLLCAAVSLAGTEGARLLAWPAVFRRSEDNAASLRAWLGLVLGSSFGLGMALRMDADSELYVFLLARVPAAVLAASFIVHLARQRRAPRTPADRPDRDRGWMRAVGLAVVALAVLVQTGVWAARNRARWQEWAQAAAVGRVEEDLRLLEAGTRWIRQHTERDAVLITNVCTSATMRADHWGAIDRTLAGVHYYYSALAERRVLVEGPNYLFNPVVTNERLALAEGIFHAGQRPPRKLGGGAPCYLVVDRRMRMERPIVLPPAERVFGNDRLEVYRMPRAAPGRGSD